MPPDYLWLMLQGYALTVAIETTVLAIGLSRRHGWWTRIVAGFWLTACTYPVVWLVLPTWLSPGEQRGLYLLVAETFAPAAECLIFWLAFGDKQPYSSRALLRDMTAIVLANLSSFAAGELLG